jgi:hypothetical protein
VRVLPFFVAVFGCSLLVACGDGGQRIPTPAPGGTERPLPNTTQDPRGNNQDPVANPQDPLTNDQDPIPTTIGSGLTPGAAGARGGNANAAGGPAR